MHKLLRKKPRFEIFHIHFLWFSMHNRENRPVTAQLQREKHTIIIIHIQGYLVGAFVNWKSSTRNGDKDKTLEHKRIKSFENKNSNYTDLEPTLIDVIIQIVHICIRHGSVWCSSFLLSQTRSTVLLPLSTVLLPLSTVVASHWGRGLWVTEQQSPSALEECALHTSPHLGHRRTERGVLHISD